VPHKQRRGFLTDTFSTFTVDGEIDPKAFELPKQRRAPIVTGRQRAADDERAKERAYPVTPAHRNHPVHDLRRVGS
jgi:hypothetical protein